MQPFLFITTEQNLITLLEDFEENLTYKKVHH